MSHVGCPQQQMGLQPLALGQLPSLLTFSNSSPTSGKFDSSKPVSLDEPYDFRSPSPTLTSATTLVVRTRMVEPVEALGPPAMSLGLVRFARSAAGNFCNGILKLVSGATLNLQLNVWGCFYHILYTCTHVYV